MRALVAIAITLLAGCSKEAAVNRGLVDAGIASSAASCMSREMAKRLSVEQLQKLRRAQDDSGKPIANMSVSDYIAAARRVGDAEVVLVTGAAAAYCDAF